MSRTKIDKEIKRSKRVYVRFTSTEYDLISTKAEQTHTTVSGYLHDVAVNGKTEIHYDFTPPSKEIAELASSLGKTGSNLNQIARYFNDGGADTEGIRTAIRRCIQELFTLRSQLRDITTTYQR